MSRVHPGYGAYPGPHELGQNHLTDRRVIARIVELIGEAPMPIVEWAAGRGAVTRSLARLGRPVEAIEVDPRSVARLRRAVAPHVVVSQGDILRHAPPRGPYDLVCNVPFHITTPVLRRLLTLNGWRRAVLLLQWEVARKRAGVGGATLLTAQWWPWYEFTLDRRVPSTSFNPRPSVDGGLLVVDRRPAPLVPPAERAAYQTFAAEVFHGRGRGIVNILRTRGLSGNALATWRRAHGIGDGHLPRDLDLGAWVDAYRLR
ncbi:MULTISPECIES: 23S ribosomal RNA methyltransferase Erm [unclassified Pseudofrankia]|uniref:23S ribosomal RNA methyltransferase Erm n=1 Tax=unclassified Pseudofrankia TaxID=2994372 RepID=UPI0008DA9594|nr:MULTISPECIES: 23S ribosomal RNA methyltransferase Erm [unclassified Pseudofrankia]MDT3442479.1 23S ribosomal RNA methyltransferase Erm [Pseudofrankia sp. BMG5.37]OHV74727.1 23S ribosomal RNA methyltransferase Erm [Pseudofrankia sp. BMG5.36]